MSGAVDAAQLTLRWDDNSSNESGFKIERATSTGLFTQIATVGANVTSYSDTSVASGTSYRYRIRAFNGAGNSTYSNIATVVTDALKEVVNVAVNEAPIIGSIANRTIAADGSKTTVPFAIGDSVTSASALTVVASSSNPALVPQTSLALAGSAGNRTLTLSALAGKSGQSVITVAVHDGELISYRTFTVSVPGSTPATLSTPATGRIGRASVRALAGSGSDTLLMEFITSGADKSMLVRAVGPTLGALGFTGVMADPRLAIRRGMTVVALNDDWGGLTALLTTFTRIGAFALPVLSRDAAVQQTLTPAKYSALVSGPMGAASGLVLAEVYDADYAAHPTGRLRALTARTPVKGGARTAVLGFTVEGKDPLPVLIRGVGSSLATSGVTGAIKRPRLEIYRGSTLIRRVDGWKPSATLLEAISRVEASRLTHMADGATLLSLEPGTYTAVLSGIDGSAGTGQVELYEVR